eukprot:3333422-Amphidinium_carterae.1
MASCTAGQTVTLELAGEQFLATLDEDLGSGYTTLLSCSTINQNYQNFATITCDNGALSFSTTGCVESLTQSVISSTLDMTLSAASGTTEDAFAEALQTDESQDALTDSLADSLGIDAARINIISVTVTAARRQLEAEGCG